MNRLLPRTATRRLGALLVAALPLTGAVLLPATPAVAEGPTLTGAGSTWSQVAVDQWRSDTRTRLGLSVNYAGVGSSSGRQFYVSNQVDFAVSEIPFVDDEVGKLNGQGKSYQYLPIVAGGTSLMYNLKDASGRPVRDLRLSPATVAGIFTGTITKWNDPAVTRDNGGRSMPGIPVIPVLRSDGSGTSAQFTAYLADQAAAQWRAFAGKRGIPPTQTSNYPEFPGSVSQRGSDGVANYVANDSTGVGSINYVETAYAIQRRRPVASLLNRSGNWTQPTAANVAIALTHATLNSDRTQNLGGVYRAPEAAAYALSSYSYMITPTTGIDRAKGEVLGKFINYFACEGQQKAEVLGYSPLPKNLVQVVFEAVRQIPGAPAPPAMSACKNPTITGEAFRSSNSGLVSGSSGTAAAGGGRTARPTGSTARPAGGTSGGTTAGRPATSGASTTAGGTTTGGSTGRPADGVTTGSASPGGTATGSKAPGAVTTGSGTSGSVALPGIPQDDVTGEPLATDDGFVGDPVVGEGGEELPPIDLQAGGLPAATSTVRLTGSAEDPVPGALLALLVVGLVFGPALVMAVAAERRGRRVVG